jgi:hypothetical protein
MGAGSESAASAPPSAVDRSSASEPAPRERPGLGTQWGETRESHIRDVDFFRANPTHPLAVAQLFYNDRAGVDALVAYRGGGPAASSDMPVANGFVTLLVVDKEWGMPLDTFRAGDSRYVVGEEGHRYSILMTNRTGRRFEAVATVDGLDVISGRRGSYENRGYVLDPWATLEVDGFRQSEDEVAAFRFSKVDESYAAQRGQARNVGVIGVAFFAERGDPWSASELRTRDTASPFREDRRFAPPPW